MSSRGKFVARTSPSILPVVVLQFLALGAVHAQDRGSKVEADCHDIDDHRIKAPIFKADLDPSTRHPVPQVAMPKHIARQVAPTSSTSRSSSPTATASTSSSSSKLQPGAIVGIAIGSAIGLGLLLMILAAYRRKIHKARKRPRGFVLGADDQAKFAAPDDHQHHQYPPQLPMTGPDQQDAEASPNMKEPHDTPHPPNLSQVEAGEV